MIERCCQTMESNSRTFRKGVPESDQRTASFEYNPNFDAYMIADSDGHFIRTINYCPWCATDLRPQSGPLAELQHPNP
jgi:hypothetical protein